MQSPSHPTVDEALASTTGVPPGDVEVAYRELKQLDARMRSYRAGSVELHLSVKDLDTRQQKTTLIARIIDHPDLVATSHRSGLRQAIIEVRDDMIRLMTDSLSKREPGKA